MNHDLLFVLALIGLPAIYYYIQVARRKREDIKFRLRRVVIYIAFLLGGFVILPSFGYSKPQALIFSIFVGTTAAFMLVHPPNFDRRIPAKIRRAVIARDLKGERFNPKLHDIDHIVPYSKGGDHSEKNLRVISRSENRSRGNRDPKLKDFF